MKNTRLVLGLICLVACTILFNTAPVYATDGPMEAIKGPVDELISILRDPIYKETGKKPEQREKLVMLIKKFFDFKQMTRLTLATNWKKFSPAQREAFIAVFTDFLAGVYINRIQGEYQNETVAYLDQKLLSPKKALVHTKIKREAADIPVSYRLYKSNKGWLTYDVIIEKVSLVQNYRAQFKRFLAKNSLEALMDQLRKKTAENKETAGK
jgi:phospholipid transport system substrate-binding protein